MKAIEGSMSNFSLYEILFPFEALTILQTFRDKEDFKFYFVTFADAKE